MVRRWSAERMEVPVCDGAALTAERVTKMVIVRWLDGGGTRVV